MFCLWLPEPWLEDSIDSIGLQVWQRKPAVFLHVSEEVFQADFVRPESLSSLNV
jgi:hypothetical protein